MEYVWQQKSNVESRTHCITFLAANCLDVYNISALATFKLDPCWIRIHKTYCYQGCTHVMNYVIQHSSNWRPLCPGKAFLILTGNYGSVALLHCVQSEFCTGTLWAVTSIAQHPRRLCSRKSRNTQLSRVSLYTAQLGHNAMMWEKGNCCSWVWGGGRLLSNHRSSIQARVWRALILHNILHIF